MSTASASTPHIVPSSTYLTTTTLVLGLLSIMIIPAFFVKPGPFVQWLQRKRYQYEVTFSLYMLTPTEKFIFNSLLFLFVSMIVIAVSLYLPEHMMTIARRVFYYVHGE